MIVYVLFALVTTNFPNTTSFTYEFKDKLQCENALKNIKKHLTDGGYSKQETKGFCQEVIK